MTSRHKDPSLRESLKGNKNSLGVGTYPDISLPSGKVEPLCVPSSFHLLSCHPNKITPIMISILTSYVLPYFFFSLSHLKVQSDFPLDLRQHTSSLYLADSIYQEAAPLWWEVTWA